MGVPIVKAPEATVVLPVYKLSTTALVLLPGILYRVAFPLQNAVNVLQFFSNNKRVSNLLLQNLKGTLTTSKGSNGTEPQQKTAISDNAIEGGRRFRKLINGDRGDESAYDWLILALVPQEAQRSCTVARIVGITSDQTSIVLTFQALTRGEIVEEGVEVRDGGVPVETKVRTVSNKVELGEESFKAQVQDYNQKVIGLFKRIDEFLRDFSSASSADKNHGSDGAKYALTLSPLANILNVQFTGEYKSSSVKLKGLIDNFNNRIPDYNNLKNSENFLKLLDLTIAVLPVMKLEFLTKLDVFERIEFFKVLIDDFSKVFTILYQSVDYVEKFYSSASDLEKSKIISNQLKSIKYSLDSLRPNRQGAIGGATLPRANSQDSEENEELKLIQNFLDKMPDDVNRDGAKMLQKDFKRLQKMPSQHSEYQVLRTYFDAVLDIPFGQYVNYKNLDIRAASKQLDDDHFGLYHVKKRLLQYLSVLKLHEKNALNSSSSKNPGNADESGEFILGGNIDQRKDDLPTLQKQLPKPKSTSKAPIILLVGPPGVGKTSLAKSIATALGRKFQRISLGGIRDESEIRGHRRTYVGSMPGVIVNALRKAGSMNPLILLDEIDKVCGGQSSAGRVNGDPSAALLEVLDPEQNVNFTDHYIGFPIDLSNVLFLCTANELSTITPPLRDRTEIIEISGYTQDEKVNIASKYLLPKQIKSNGLNPGDLTLSQEILSKIVSEYVREAGVRNLERQIGAICRGKAVEYVSNEKGFKNKVQPNELVKYLGLPAHPISKEMLEKPKFSYDYGVVNGLSYNSDGSGAALVFEIVSIPTLNKNQSSPNLVLTGRLGETLTESIKIGVSFVKSIISRNLIQDANQEILSRFNNSELHLHVPMGGISKDGPSAGITITLALLSTALQRSVPSDIAMTGEITLRGKVLPIGGVAEKLLGASQFGIKTVLIPKLNRKDIIEGFYNEDEEKLMELLNDDSINEPELKVKQKLGIQLIYVDTFWDVIKAVWGDSVVEQHLAHNL